MTTLLARLREPQSAPVLADGAMGTMLQRAGLPPGQWSAAWSLHRPDAVLAVHRAFVAAGSELLLANSFGADEGQWPAAEVAPLNQAAVRLARQAGARWVVGALGPGAGPRQVAALAQAGVDALWLETQLGLRAALTTLAHCRSEAPLLPCLVTFSFHRADGLTQTGESAATVAPALAEAGASALGLNCGQGLHNAAALLAQMRACCTLPLLLKPSAAPTHSPRQWGEALARTMSPPVRVVGGCCGSGPPHLAALAAAQQGRARSTG